MNRKGFTLIELLTTIVVLAIIMGIAGYAITNVITSSKESDYKIFIDEINNAVELYYQECKYSSVSSIDCPIIVDNKYKIKLGDLVTNGYLKGNSTDSNGYSTLVNPKDNENISECEIEYGYSNGKISVEAVDPSGSCPTSY